MYEWSDIRFFLAVARAGSTSSAARTLRVNQTTVVRRIESLEAALKVRLFDRNQDGYRLSEAGENLFAQAERLEAEAATFERLAAQHGRSLSGTIRVTTMESFATLFLTPMLTEFIDLYPDINVEVISAEDRLDLARGEADLAIRAGRMPDEPGLMVRKFADDPWAVYCSGSYATKYGPPKCDSDLASHFVVGVEGSLSQVAPFQWFADAAAQAKVRSTCSTIANLLAAVRAGHGVGALPKMVLPVAENDLVECFSIPYLGSAFYLVTRADMKDVPRIRAFSEFIVDRMASVKPVLEGRSQAKR